MREPRRLMVEYEDGSMKGIEFSQLSPATCLELSQKGLCPPPAERPEALKHYLLLLWKNGWQEVIGVDKPSLELLRYYILERVEEVGRLALEVKGEYPLLVTIGRLPKELQRIIIVGKEDAKGYSLEPKMKKEEGDKIEHVEFDKAERHFQSDPDQKAESWYGELVNSLRAELEKRGLTAEKILARGGAQRINEYKELAKTLNIRATEKQQDVYGLMELLMEKLAAIKE